MLGSARVVPTLPAVDIERAKRFYIGTLGLRLAVENPGGVVLECGEGARLALYPRAATKADHTVAGFDVQDVEATVSDLRQRGVVFEEYNTPEIKTLNGIASMGPYKGAWFKDTEGNILGVSNVG